MTNFKASLRLAAIAAVVVSVSAVVAPSASADPESNAPAGQHTIYRQFVTATSTVSGVTDYSITQTAEVLKPGIESAPATITPSGVLTSCPEDGSSSVEICEQLYYTSYKSGSSTYASTSEWDNQATRIDRQATLIDLAWSGAQHGRCVSSCGGTSDWNYTYHGDYSYPTSGTNYPTKPPKGSPTLLIGYDPANNNYQNIQQTLTWGRGSAHYTLKNPPLYIPSL
ncbi:hypothetical protein [Streptomyces sp. NPDC049040]|uniref:hypothetical protein n=1 Tax=Streptomyces sp. NPDC049040 TaxID=3365593 RepID=UPI00371D78A8